MSANIGEDHNSIAPLLARGLRTRDAANYIGFSEAFLRKARRVETKVPGPIFQRIGSRVIYLREDLDAFLDQSKQESA